MSKNISDKTVELTTLIKPIIDAAIENSKNHNLVLQNDILVSLGKIEERLELIEKLVSAPKARAAKSPAANSSAPQQKAANANSAAKLKSYPANKRLFFIENYKKNEFAFKDRFTPADAVEEIKKDASIQKKPIAQQDNAIAGLVWNIIKAKHADMMKEIEEEYEKFKAHLVEPADAPLEVESRTPPPERKEKKEKK